MPRLHTRIYAHSLLVLFVVAALTSGVFVWGARKAFTREMSERLAWYAANLAGETLADPVALARRIARLHNDWHLDVTVRDLDGHLVTVAGTELPPLLREEVERVSAGGVVRRSHPEWFTAVLVRDPAGVPLGVLALSAHRRVGLGMLLQPLVVIVIVLLIVAVTTLPLAHRIARPLEQLTQASRRLGGGDLSTRVPIPAGGGQRWGRRSAGRPDEIQELTRAFNDMAERVEGLVRGQKELLANVSHELRSPLTRIRMALALLPNEGADQSRLADVESDLAELDRLVEDVLATARLEMSKLPPRLEVAEARELLGEIIERCRHDPRFAGKHVILAPGAPVELVADAVLLKRAFSNLVENAAKYGTAPITLSASTDGDSVLVAVVDEGPGIPVSERERVFAPFYRLDRAHTPRADGGNRSGTGLGLTFARRVADVHGGTIGIQPASVQNGHEQGCRVVITLPRQGPLVNDPDL